MSPIEENCNFCTEHFYVRETLKDVRKEQFRFRKDMFQIKLILMIVLINTLGFSEVVWGLL